MRLAFTPILLFSNPREPLATSFIQRKVEFNKKNGAAAALEKVAAEISKNSSLLKFLKPIAEAREDGKNCA